ncbi:MULTISPECIES: Cro/CI family transcriptional regulator [Shewanella]|uniref:Cro/Cl family transcriptional regulator n=1 Tax=Shewanella cutis TaxID=2766780 RepID=A0ABS9QPW1_9GAMM|nr:MULTISPECIES: Cro/CI family transcriptional regulator [Shewanella]MCG9962375.1 Cro/Cl family transcriptional regulator [Shewanella sp. PS-2]MCT8871578.1 Cro/Cl family transcriptional regulator [Shewanella xiamenensis]UWH43583.1 Cro/Cl family transcriptional regulator [Shewanella xiamenensis]
MKKTDAIKYFGSSIKLAEALGLNKSAVSQWGEEVPELRAFQLERLTGGELKVHADKAIESTSSPRVA